MYWNKKMKKLRKPLLAAAVLAFVFAYGATAHAVPSAPPSGRDTTETRELVAHSSIKSMPGGIFARATAGFITGCTSAYDYPHPSKSSGYKRINAHYTVTCIGVDAAQVKITVRSKMTTTSGRSGALNVKTGKKKTMTGGDLSCTTATASYQAKGSYTVVFPEGYKPRTASFSKNSAVKKFKLATSGKKKGQCIPA